MPLETEMLSRPFFGASRKKIGTVIVTSLIASLRQQVPASKRLGIAYLGNKRSCLIAMSPGLRNIS